MISPFYYHDIFLIFVTLLTIGVSISLSGYSGQFESLQRYRKSLWMFLVCVLLVFFIGLRPRHAFFVDSSTYEDIYNLIVPYGDFDWTEGDVLFNLLMVLAQPVMSWRMFALLIAAVYFMSHWVACKRFVPENADIMMLFCLGSFSFYGYATNGLRNGMACALVLLALTYLIKDKPKMVGFLVVSILAIGNHKSTLLPCACALLAYYYRNPKTMFYVWLIAIPLGLLAGGTFESLFSSLLEDDRFDQYVSLEKKQEYAYLFSHTGFRWDFLLYSFMPILLGWYVIFRRKIIDRKYVFLLATYIYANAFWILVINSSNSNRFAYLSWFLYPVVLCYPLLKLPVFRVNHVQKTRMIMLTHLAFTLFMHFLYIFI